MQAAYDAAWGWSDSAKRDELTSDAARFILVRPRQGAAPTADAATTPPPGTLPPLAAYVHFRYEVADPPSTDAVLYVYEVQLAAAARRAGLGRFLMQLLELAARRAGLAALTLTVQDVNAGARALYAGLGYVRDDGSPTPGVDSEGYQILIKRLPQRPGGATKAAAGGAAAEVRVAAL